MAGKERAATGREAIGKCPRCGGTVIEGRKGFGCSRWRQQDGGCRWVIWKDVAGKDLTAAQARELLTAGETKREIKGFKSKAGKEFAARVKLDRDTGRVSFVFEDRPAAAAAGKVPAARSGAATTRPGTRKPAGHGQP